MLCSPHPEPFHVIKNVELLPPFTEVNLAIGEVVEVAYVNKRQVLQDQAAAHTHISYYYYFLYHKLTKKQMIWKGSAKKDKLTIKGLANTKNLTPKLPKSLNLNISIT